MTTPRALLLALAVSALALLLAAPVHAQQLGVDAEVDPIAYAANGHSLHVGVWLDAWRFDLGSFAAELPAFAHGNPGFEVHFTGFGAKVDRYLDAEGEGWFFGVEGALVRATIQRPDLQLADDHLQATLGVRGGYRWTFLERFYLQPWIGLGYAFNAKDVTLGEQRFEGSPFTVFPTVHVGYRFE